MVNFSPRFIAARISFSFGKGAYELGEHLINSTGLPGMAWHHFNPILFVGQRVTVQVEVLSPSEPFKFACEGFLTCEQTETATQLGLTFLLRTQQRTTLEAIISREGTYPDYVRKFPRINFMPTMKVMPSRSVLRMTLAGEEAMVASDIENMSPAGIMVHTEDSRCAFLIPGETVHVQLQPRGEYHDVINLTCAVRRIIRTVSHESEVLGFKLGMGISAMTHANKKLFTELLREIVTRLKVEALP